MKRDYHRWYSRLLRRDMELLVFGHSGPPVIVFPSAKGSFFEFEDRGMVDALQQKLDNGWLQLFCVSSVDSESWYAKDAQPRQRIDRYLHYESYLLDDVVAFIRRMNAHDGLGVTGCSFGAYHAMAMALRHPHTFNSCTTMGGAFDISQLLSGYADQDAYLLNPAAFLPGLNDAHYLDRLRRNKFVLATGEWDIYRTANEDFSRILAAKGIPHSLHVWGFGSKHDWPDWRPMANAYLP